MDVQTRQLLDRLFDRLDRIDYYEILGVPHAADAEALRNAFYARADVMHPDRHYNIVDSDLREKLYLVYKRVAEAYRVLSATETRRDYDRQLARGRVRFQADTHKDVKRDPETTIRNLRARKLYLDARQALESGNLQGALLALRMADSMEPGSPVIRASIDEVVRGLGTGKK
jgi:curved DNA-binding protein CbpA